MNAASYADAASEAACQTLYVHSAPGTRLHADDAAFIVEPPQRSAARCPLTRVGRLVVRIDRVDVHASALRAALAARRPILFVGPAGQILGQLLPEPAPVRDERAAVLAAFFAAPDSVRRYSDWLRHARNRIALAGRDALLACGHFVERSAFARFRKRLVWRLEPVPALSGSLAVLNGAFGACVAQVLQDCGLRADYVSDDGMRVWLACDLRDLLVLERHLLAGVLPPVRRTPAEQVLLEFERRRREYERRVQAHVNELLRLAAEHLHHGS